MMRQTLTAALVAVMLLPLAVVAPLVAQGTALRDVARGDQSNVETSKQAVSRTAAQWATMWKEHNWENPAPRVDFSKEMAVAVFLGTQQTAGVTVQITEVAPKATGGVVIRYRVTRPAAGQVSAQVLTFPYHIVAAPAHDGPYTFEKID